MLNIALGNILLATILNTLLYRQRGYVFPYIYHKFNYKIKNYFSEILNMHYASINTKRYLKIPFLTCAVTTL